MAVADQEHPEHRFRINRRTPSLAVKWLKLLADRTKVEQRIRLAQQMVRLTGLPEDRIPIQVTGLRPGEKLYEGKAKIVSATEDPNLVIQYFKDEDHVH